MSNFLAIMWTVKPGTEDKVREAFANYGRPDHDVKDQDGNVVGKLIATQVFMKRNVIVRAIEFEGELMDLAPHMGRQPAIRELEDKIEPYLEKPRDMSTPEGAREYFFDVAMETLIARRWDD